MVSNLPRAVQSERADEESSVPGQGPSLSILLPPQSLPPRAGRALGSSCLSFPQDHSLSMTSFRVSLQARQWQSPGFVLLQHRDGFSGSFACSPPWTTTGPSTPATHSGCFQRPASPHQHSPARPGSFCRVPLACPGPPGMVGCPTAPAHSLRPGPVGFHHQQLHALVAAIPFLERPQPCGSGPRSALRPSLSTLAQPRSRSCSFRPPTSGLSEVLLSPY